MKRKHHSSTVFNVVNSNVQILPNARQAVLNIYGLHPDESSVSPSSSVVLDSSPEVVQLATYINKREDLDGYLLQLASCTTASDLARIIVSMLGREPAVTPDLVVKQRFISLFLPLAPKLVSGKSIDNIRCRINDLLTRRPHRH